MSLINEALKKAQKLRTQEQTAAPPPTPGGGQTPAPIVPRRQPLSARTVVWSVFGAVSLILFSVAFTILFLGNDDAAPAAPPAAPTIAHAPAASPSPAPVTVAPAPVTPASESEPAPEPKSTEVPVLVPAPTQPPPSPVVVTPVEPASPPPSAPVVIDPAPTTAIAPVPAPSPARTAPPRPDPQVYKFIDTLRISGIRASATDPKVLMNDRLFRLNDIVDRGSGLRLTRIGASSLTFVDNTGAVYTKNF